jgi:hypothetical protein
MEITHESTSQKLKGLTNPHNKEFINHIILGKMETTLLQMTKSHT